MRLGPAVRQRLGRFEEPAAEAYRRPFINLDDLGDSLGRIPGVDTILEVGAGEGAVASRLTRVFPTATYLGIDIIDNPGRLFRGDQDRAEFASTEVHRLDADRLFDLVVLVDVLHHVPLAERHQVLADAHAHVKPGGHLVVKEWERSRSAGQAAWYVVDRLVGGDPNVRAFDARRARGDGRRGLRRRPRGDRGPGSTTAQQPPPGGGAGLARRVTGSGLTPR